MQCSNPQDTLRAELKAELKIAHQLLWGNTQLRLQRGQPQLHSNVTDHQFHNSNRKIVTTNPFRYFKQYFLSLSKSNLKKYDIAQGADAIQMDVATLKILLEYIYIYILSK